MSESLSDWLALREAADAAARSKALTQAVADSVAAPLHVVDLGTGTGSNVRFLAPQLPSPQYWRVIDVDAAVLADFPRRMARWAQGIGASVDVRTNAVRIAAPSFEAHIALERRPLGALEPSLFAGSQLVTASALLDLVSDRWLSQLAASCRTAGAAALFALTYDGRSTCDPGEPEDEDIRALMNRHQRNNDKGFGRAAGPDAAAAAVRAFESSEYRVRTESSDWALGAGAEELQRQLFEGWAAAATEMAPERTPAIVDWLARRRSHVDRGDSRVVVGHVDIAAWR